MSYNPHDWYWLADDGRVFASARQVVVNTSDPDYATWSAANTATSWPRDDVGNQTNAALQAVLTPYNLWVDLVAYAAYARYNKASGSVIISSLSPVAFNSDPVSRNTINSAYDYVLANAAAILNWKMVDGSFITVNKAAVTTMANDIAVFVHNCFTCEKDTVDGINGGTITTQAQVDAAFAAISNVFP